MTRSCSLPDLTRISVQQLVGQLFDQFFEPLTWSTRIQSDYYFSLELTVKLSQLRSLFVLQRLPLNDPIGCVAVTYRLLIWVKVYSDVYCHMGTSCRCTYKSSYDCSKSPTGVTRIS